MLAAGGGFLATSAHVTVELTRDGIVVGQHLREVARRIDELRAASGWLCIEVVAHGHHGAPEMRCQRIDVIALEDRLLVPSTAHSGIGQQIHDHLCGLQEERCGVCHVRNPMPIATPLRRSSRIDIDTTVVTSVRS